MRKQPSYQSGPRYEVRVTDADRNGRDEILRGAVVGAAPSQAERGAVSGEAVPPPGPSVLASYPRLYQHGVRQSNI